MAAVTTPTTPTPEPITVVIPAHAPSAALRECLHALSSCVPPPERVILVLDGTSWPEGGLPFVADSVEVVALGRQAGAAAARNAGWRRAVGTWVVFIDSDVAVPGDFMNRLQETMSCLTGVDAFFGSYDANPRAPGLFSRYRNLLHHFTHQTGNEHASTFWTGCGAVKRAALERVGGFDEKVDFMEDIELGMRLLRNGSKITLVKSLQVTHLKRWRLRDIWLTDVRRRALPWSRILIQAGETSRDLNLSPRSRFSGVLAVAGTLLITLTPVSPFLGLAGILSLGLLVAMNARFYAFLARTGGGAALLPGIFFHYLYFLLSSITFAFALVEAAIRRKKIFFGPL